MHTQPLLYALLYARAMLCMRCMRCKFNAGYKLLLLYAFAAS